MIQIKNIFFPGFLSPDRYLITADKVSRRAVLIIFVN